MSIPLFSQCYFVFLPLATQWQFKVWRGKKMGTELRHVQIYKLCQQNDSDYRV